MRAMELETELIYARVLGGDGLWWWTIQPGARNASHFCSHLKCGTNRYRSGGASQRSSFLLPNSANEPYNHYEYGNLIDHRANGCQEAVVQAVRPEYR